MSNHTSVTLGYGGTALGLLAIIFTPV